MNDNDYERYRQIGEIYGRVRKDLPCGELWFTQAEVGILVFHWHWKAKGKRWGLDYTFDFKELESSNADNAMIADRLIALWKRKASEAMKDG